MSSEIEAAAPALAITDLLRSEPSSALSRCGILVADPGAPRRPGGVKASGKFRAEIFYFHDAYYRGLIGRTLVFDRALSAEEVGALTRE